MRRVMRTAAPPSLSGPISAGGRELAKAREFFQPVVGTPGTGTFAFTAYKAADVRAAMRAMFHRKCAYCETFYAAAMPDDVEHYRPKAGYTEGGKQHKPGYWWLAMEWTNLLPSCADCNRARSQELVGTERRTVVGKANQFPLAEGSTRGSADAGVVSEQPLLLDPTVDDPAEHLEFLPDGVVRARLVDGGESARGQATIDVVALLRRDLVDARAAASLATRAAIQHVVDTLDDVTRVATRTGVREPDRAAELALLRERLTRNVAELEVKAAAETPYSSVAEALITEFKAGRGL